MALVRMMRKRQLEPESGHPACVNRRIPKADTSIAPLAAFSSAPPSAALFAGAIVGRGLLAADGRLAVPRAPSGSLHRIELSVQREPTNEYDPNALLWCCDAGPMGYATRTLAAAVTPLLSASKVRVVGLLRTQHARLAAADTKCNIAMDVVVHVVCPSILQRLHAAVEPSPGRPPLDVCVARLREAWLHDGVPFMPARAPMGATGVGALPPSAKRRRSKASVVGGVQQQTPSPTIPGGNQMRLTGSLSGRRGPAVQASSCDVARHFPKRVLVLLFSSPGLSVRDVVLGARGVCRAWRDAADSPDCAPARRAFALLHHTFSGATPSPTAAPGTALAAAVPVATTAEDARPPSLPAWASEPLPTSFETLMRWVAAAQPLSCDMAWLVAQWATGQFPVPSSGPAASQAVLLRRIMEAALEQLPPLRRAVGGWAAICAMLLFTTEDVARRLLWVLFTCPAKVSHSAAAAGLRDFPWRQDVINVVYLLLLALSSPEWLRVGPTPGGVTGGSFGELGRTKALLTLEAREDLVARSRVMCHALNVGSTVAVAGSVGPYPSFDSPGCVVAGVPPDMCSTMARGMSRKLHAPPHDLCQIPNSSTHIRQRASPVVRAVKHQHPAAEDEEEETLQRAATSATPRSLLDVLRVPDSYHDLLARADGRTQFLLACMRSAENPLGGLSSSPSSRGAWALKVSPAATGETKSRRLTEEQLSIVQTDVGPGQLLRVLAFAGSGKTTTLIEYATARQHKRMLYLVFNVSVREDAEGRFPPNVTVKSIHQLAFAEVGRRYSGRRQLVSELSTKMITRALGLGSGSGMFELATWVKDTVLQFCHSVDRAMHLHHLPAAVAGRLPTGFTLQQALRMVPKRQPGDASSRQSFDARHVLGFAQRLWDAMVDLADQSVSMTHAGYLKLFHLSKPDLGKHFAAILLDEAQDCAPVVADTVLSQSCGVVLVGDPHQSVYSFAGAVDTLSASFSASASGRAGWDPLHGRTVTVRRLTRSFRFGPNIARAAASILRCRKLEPEPLIGLPLALREDRVRLETPAPMHSAQGMLPPRMVGTMLASQRIVSAIDSPLHPWLLHARRAGFLRRLLNASDVQRVLAATKEGKEAPELSGPSASTPWTVALLARGNVTLMFLAWQLTTLCVDSSKPRHLPPHPSLLQKKYERAHRDGLKSVAIAKPVHTGRCPRIGVLGMNDRNPADHAFGMRQLEDVCCLALKVKSLIDSPLIRAFNS